MGWREKYPDNYIHSGGNYFIFVEPRAFVKEPTVSVRDEYWAHLLINRLPLVTKRHTNPRTGLEYPEGSRQTRHISRYEGQNTFILAVLRSKFENISRSNEINPHSHEPHHIKRVFDAGGGGTYKYAYLVKGRYVTDEIVFHPYKMSPEGVSERQPANTLHCPICFNSDKAKIVFDHPDEWFHEFIASCEDCVDQELSHLQEAVTEARMRKQEMKFG